MSLHYTNLDKVSILNKKFENYNDFISNEFSIYPFELDDFQKHSIEKILLNENILITANTGSGKCHKKDTEILMYDGSIKKVQNIKKNELIMGDDSTPRKVLGLARGIEMMYNIILSDGTSFGCNESHILCLKYQVKPTMRIDKRRNAFCVTWFDNKNIKMNYKQFNFNINNKEKIKKITEDFLKEKITNHKSEFIISVRDFLKKSKYIQRNSLSYRNSIDFSEKKIEIDPYIMGLWLGDGHSKNVNEITNQDAVILKYLNSKAKEYNCYLHHKKDYTYVLKTLNKNNGGRGYYNDFIEKMSKYNLINNKHIPNDYKINSRENRLKLLAGLIDTDGYYSKCLLYEIVQKNNKLSNDIVYLVRSLGFHCTIKKTTKYCYYKGEKKEDIYNRIYISGDKLDEIPVLCKRKKGEKRVINKPSLCYFFKVEKVGIDNYYGFNLDGNHKYFLGNFIITHNTLPAEYSIINSVRQGKKVIYTSPIKSLSNQKFFEFKKKFKNTSFGILTGDIKFNPEADCIIMTTEILRNLLYKKQYDSDKINYKLDLDIDLNNDIHSIIFDEVHYINDQDRGKVWEECLVLLPKHINLVLLSATINNAEEFAFWLQKIKNKPCHLIPKKERIIPLNHYLFYTTKYPKKSKTDKFHIDLVTKKSDKLVHIMDNDKKFNDLNYEEIKKLKMYDLKANNYYNNDVVVIQKMIKLLKNKSMLPSLFFVLSRKKCLKLAQCIEHSLINKNEMTQIKNIVNYNIHKLDNPDFYLKSNEFYELEPLLYKGVAIHHSGLRPIFKEIIEILYANGLIKVLFATETFAIGVNMPTKSVIFTDIKKFTNTEHRFFKTSEYLQMAGRAGRRGLDTVGNVILMANMFDMPNITKVKNMMAGNTEDIISKFEVSYKFILKILLNNEYNFNDFLNNTLIFKQNNQDNIDNQNRLNYLEKYFNELNLNFDFSIFDKYYILKYETVKLTKNNKKFIKKIENNKDFDQNYKLYLEKYELYNEMNYLKNKINDIDYNTYIFNSLKNILNFLNEYNYITNYNNLDSLSKDNITLKGIICSQINECNEILLSEMLLQDYFDDLDDKQICGLLSVFCNTKCLNDDMKVYNVDILDIDDLLKNKLKKLESLKNDFQKKEENLEIFINTEWELNFDMVEYNYKWCNGDSFNSLNFDNYIGNFIKDVLKLDNLLCTLEVLCTNLEKYDLYNKLVNIHSKILRDIVTSESLYIKM